MSTSATPETDVVSTPQPTPLRKLRRAKRLPTDIIGQLEDKLEEDDLNLKTWVEYLTQIKKKDKTEQVRETYERFLKKFPFISQQWINYIEYELERGEFDKAEELFKNSLIKVSGVKLWQCYVSYVRRKNNLITGGEEARRTIFRAFDAAIEKVGIDPNSESLWLEYLQFIDSWKPVAHYDEQQKVDIKRSVYKRALKLPLKNLEKLWADYTTFETELNATTARKFISESSGAYMNARSWLREWNNITEKLNREFENYEDNTELADQFQIWMNWIKWEKTNKLELEDAKLTPRIDYVFKQATERIIFVPQLWFEYISFMDLTKNYYTNQNKFDTLGEGIAANPLSFLLNLKLVEKFEIENNSVLVEKKFQELAAKLTDMHEDKAADIEEVKERLIYSEIERLKSFSKLGQDEDEEDARMKGAEEKEDEEEIKLNDQVKENIFAKSQELRILNKELTKISRTITLTNCQYLRSMNRLKGLKDARQIFSEVRKKKATLTHHIFVEAAKLEEISGERKIALKVFELGLKQQFFQNDGEYIFKYLKYLIKINDQINFNAIFENTVNSVKFDKIEKKWLVAIFKLYLSFQGNFTINQNNLEKYEQKFFAKFPNYSKVSLFADRFTSGDDMFSVSDLELGQDFELEDGDNLVKAELLKSEVKPVVSNGSSDANQRKRKNSVAQEPASKKPNTDNTIIVDEPEGDGKDIVTDEIYNILRVLPRANYLEANKNFVNVDKLVDLLKSLD